MLGVPTTNFAKHAKIVKHRNNEALPKRKEDLNPGRKEKISDQSRLLHSMMSVQEVAQSQHVEQL